MTTIRQALLQESGNGRLEPEIRDLLDELQQRGIPTHLFTAKRLRRRQLPLALDTLVAGYVDAVQSALRQLRLPVPEPNDYPKSLEPFLHRRVWQSTVGNLMQQLADDSGPAVFAKPKGRMKRFTGRVFESWDDLRSVHGISRRLPVWCSEVVEWRSEYRVYVIRGEVVGIRLYAGESQTPLDEAVVREALRKLHDAGEALAAFGIDFGVLSDGRTALVEMNDGFALGSYGLERGRYTDLILARWSELTRRREQ